MSKKKITCEIMNYMIWVVEITSRKYFSGDKGKAYRALRNCGIWDLYVEHYDVTHTLGAEVILEEINERISSEGDVTIW